MNAYQTLGLKYGASPEDIKKAFHRLAHIHHPDKGGDAEVFKKISAAYAELKNVSVYRSKYSQGFTPAQDSAVSDIVQQAWDNLYAEMARHNADVMRQQQEAMRQRMNGEWYGSGATN